MKKVFLKFGVMVACAVLATSCLGGDDDTSVTYSDTAITQFTLGTLNRYTHSTSSLTGNDTIIKTTMTGSVYQMTIDHLNGRIYNVTELPVGTDTAHVVCTIYTKNSGAVGLKSMTSDSLYWHYSTDSVNFSRPRTFRVFSSDGAYYRDYVVQLNVSATQGVNFGWELVKTDPALAGWTDKRLTAVGDTVMLADRDSIVGTSTGELYMLKVCGRMFCSRDGGDSWMPETLDDEPRLLPDADGAECVAWPYAPAANTDYVLLVGRPQQEDETTMRVWRKICPHEGGGQWVYMPFDDTNYFPLRKQEWMTMAYYEGSVLCIGSDKVMRQSRDQGVSWHTSTTYTLPEALSGSRMLLAAGTNKRLWLLTDSGQLWMGGLR